MNRLSILFHLQLHGSVRTLVSVNVSVSGIVPSGTPRSRLCRTWFWCRGGLDTNPLESSSSVSNPLQKGGGWDSGDKTRVVYPSCVRVGAEGHRIRSRKFLY